ncbi:MAG: glycogen synthase GlgA [bacterium]
MKSKLNILHVSPEVVPFAKSGGLADVVGSLPEALASLGHEVRVFLPFYRMIKEGGFKIRRTVSQIDVPVGERSEGGVLLEADYDQGVTVYFLQHDAYFDRAHLYGTPQGDYEDNAERFIFFCRSLLKVLKALDLRPDIIHCHDWQTGLIPVYLKTLWEDEPLLSSTSCCYTIHNIAYQGLFAEKVMPMTGLPRKVFTTDGMEFWEKVNFMKAGINYSDVITTVSPKYSQEIQTPEYGYGLEGVLKNRRGHLYGVLNGIDTNEWDPERDEHLKANYSIHDLSGKERCKEDLLKSFNMNESAVTAPLLGLISRLADQKGFDLLAQIMDELMAMDLGFVLLGTGDQMYQDMFKKIARKYPRKMGIKIGFDNALAHRIEAGCDMFLMPSRYEPCGLNQMYSLRYGTIPIVRATGGLDDTVEQYDPTTGKGNGFKFMLYSPAELLDKIREAVDLYKDKDAWRHLMRNGMQAHFSWAQSAKKYGQIYEKALNLHYA